MSYHWYDFVGNIGVALVLITYFLLQLEKLDNKSLAYSSLNALGALLLLVSLYYKFNLSSVIIEIFWLAISLIGVVKFFQTRNRQ